MSDNQSSKPDSNTNNNSNKTSEQSTAKVGERKYAVLMETNGEECESWLYFLKYEGNEKNLKMLQEQLEQVDWFIMDDLSTFDLEIEYLVSEITAKEMTKVDLNHKSFNRKFDGTLKPVNLKFKKNDKNEKKIQRAFDKLGYGQIEDYIDEEDIDEEDLATHTVTESEEESSEESSEDEESSKENIKTLPKTLKNKIDIPRYAKAKKKNRKKNN